MERECHLPEVGVVLYVWLDGLQRCLTLHPIPNRTVVLHLGMAALGVLCLCDPCKTVRIYRF